MAQYETDPQNVTVSLLEESQKEGAGITEQTVAAINAVLDSVATPTDPDDPDSPTQVDFVEVKSLDDVDLVSDTTDYIQVTAEVLETATPEQLQALAEVPVLVIQGNVSTAIENALAPAPGESRVVIGSDEGELITYRSNDGEGDQPASRKANAEGDAIDGDITLDMGGGNDSVETAGGADSITGGAGDDSIGSGAGADSIATGVGKDTIDAGEGVDYVSFDANLEDIEVIVGQDGVVTVRDITTGELAATRNADFIELDDGTAIVNAADQGDATAGRLVSSTVGDYGYDEYAGAFELEDEKDNIDLVAFAEVLLAETELGSFSDADFIEALYQGTFGRSVDEEGLAFYLSELDSGAKTRAEVFADLGWSEEGTEHFGFVNIIDDIV